ncbi:MAG: LPS export ABC transporter periplasmic protein LptC [Reyranellaceae bacterium]
MAQASSSPQDGARLDRVLMQPRGAPRVSPLAPLVPWMRLGFPLLAMLAVIVGLVWPLLLGEGAFRLSSVPVVPAGDTYMRMENPRFTGSDGHERRFNVTADAAIQIQPDDTAMDLVSPKGDLTTPQGSWMSLSADAGRYDQKKQWLDLRGHVELFRDDGYQVTTEKASIDLKAGVASGDAPVEGQGPAGHVNSEGFRVDDRGRIIEFTGKAHLVLHDGGALPGLSDETQ